MDAASEAIAVAIAAYGLIQNPSLKLDFMTEIARAQLLAGDTDAAQLSIAPALAELEALPAGFKRDALMAKVLQSGVLFANFEVVLARIDRAYIR